MAIVARIYRDDDSWTVEIPRARGFVGSAKSLSRLRTGMRKAIREFYPELSHEHIREVFELPADAKRTLREIAQATEVAQRAQSRALELKRRGARRLQNQLGISIRDVGSLVGISSARAQQLLKGD